jgi:hypothetical protein
MAECAGQFGRHGTGLGTERMPSFPSERVPDLGKEVGAPTGVGLGKDRLAGDLPGQAWRSVPPRARKYSNIRARPARFPCHEDSQPCSSASHCHISACGSSRSGAAKSEAIRVGAREIGWT